MLLFTLASPLAPLAAFRRAGGAGTFTLLLALLLATSGAAQAQQLAITGTGGGTPGNDVTAFVDKVEIVRVSDGAVMTGALANASFEAPVQSAGGFTYRPTGSTWVFVGNTGTSAAGGTTNFAPPATPDGTQVALVQSTSSNVTGNTLSQALTLATGTYQVRFLTARRVYANGPVQDQGLAVAVGGLSVGVTTPATTTGYVSYTSTAFTLNSNGSTTVGSMTSGTASAPVAYVSSSVAASGAGTTWGTAYKTLHEALVAASAAGSPLTEVWIKGGTYYPTAYPVGSNSGATARDYAFALRNGLAIYGGFAGTETAVAQRVAGNSTILSGDIGTVGDNTDNCHHVFIQASLNGTAALDGVTITAANANVNTLGVGFGGTVISRAYGGGMFNYFSSPTLTGCTFSANTAITSGSGMFNSTSSPTLTGCTFSANTAITSGGGMFNSTSSPTLTGCTFSANTAGTTTGIPSGGGLYNDAASTLTLADCRFLSNSIAFGGGGGAILNVGTVAAVRCVFAGNTSGSLAATTTGSGGAFQNNGTTGVATFTSCVFAGNQARGTDDDGGGAICLYGGTATLTNCTLWNNTTTSSYNTSANGAYVASGATLTATNCLWWGTAAQVQNSGTASFTYCDVRGNSTGTGNFDADPSFTNPATPAGADGTWGTADDGLTLKPCSPALNTGTPPAPAVPTDYLGQSRVGAYDLGAYEYQAAAILPALAAAAATYTTAQLATTTYGDCEGVLATVASAGTSPVGGSLTARVYVQSSTPSVNGQPYVRRTYDLAPATGASTATATVTVYFTQADFTAYNSSRGSYPALPLNAADAANNRVNLRVTQEHGTSASGLPGSYTGWAGSGPAAVLLTPTSVTYNTPLARWEVTFPVTGFSGFFAHTALTNAPLPVQLTAFTAEAVGSATRLRWATASELNNDHFAVEASADGHTFTRLGTVAGHGTTLLPQQYGFTDENLPRYAAPLVYYRLQQVDLDGTFSYSPVRTVTLTAAGLALFPNPAHGAATLTGALPGTVVTVYDALGRPIATATADAVGTAALVLPAGLATGVYVVRVGSKALRLTVE